MTLREIRAKRKTILRIAARNGAKNVRVFGSVTRGEAGPKSDIDFLVDMDKGRSLLDRANLLNDLRDLLGKKIDLVTENSIYWLLRRRIMREAVPL